MKFDRRQFLGAVVAGSAGLVAPRGFASVKVSDRPVLLPRAMAALNAHGPSIAHRDMIGIVDFAAPSHLPRLHLLDVGNGRVVTSLLVAHGRGSDPANSGWVEQLSNRPGSNASCQGSFLTGETYVGHHGKSRRLHGLDPDNSLAESRAIVIHAAPYVDAAMASTQGRIGRSQGCFAVSKQDIAELLDRLGTGRLLFAAKHGAMS
jgi:hypothetical protein